MIITRKTHGVTDEHIFVTREFFSLLRGILNSNDFSKSAINLIKIDDEACMELFRHCLCLALDLDSTLSYTELKGMIDYVSKSLRNIMPASIVDKSDSFRKGFVEACMHCIVISRNTARGEK